jgi:hypothetical protein
LGKIKRQNRRKYVKIWDDQITQLIEAMKTSYKKLLLSKKTEDKMNTTATQH